MSQTRRIKSLWSGFLVIHESKITKRLYCRVLFPIRKIIGLFLKEPSSIVKVWRLIKQFGLRHRIVAMWFVRTTFGGFWAMNLSPFQDLTDLETYPVWSIAAYSFIAIAWDVSSKHLFISHSVVLSSWRFAALLLFCSRILLPLSSSSFIIVPRYFYSSTCWMFSPSSLLVFFYSDYL